MLGICLKFVYAKCQDGSLFKINHFETISFVSQIKTVLAFSILYSIRTISIFQHEDNFALTTNAKQKPTLYRFFILGTVVVSYRFCQKDVDSKNAR